SGTYVEPEQVIQAARNQGAKSIAYTYTEPTIFFEYAYEISRLAHEAGMANLFITNGYMTEEMLEIYAPYLDAANVDLKAFKDSTYRKYVGAQLQPVLDSLKEMRRLGIWVEVTTLVIPELNDDPDELREAASFVANELGPQTPWHLSAFFPAYKMRDYSATSLKSLLKAKEIGKEEGLWHIYLGNARSAGVQDTICPSCGQTLIRRSGFGVTSNEVRNGRCPECGTEIAGVWQTEDDHIQ
ncbi:MAG: AmmeMemoRadiSam system radical SAM enzyme, partial [Anaerolineales bacterium]